MLCISEVISFRAATMTSWHFLLAKWQLTFLAYFRRSVESPARYPISFRLLSKSSVCLMTWEHNWILYYKECCAGVMLTNPCNLTSLYSASWLLLVGMEWTKHSRMMHSDISSQIRSPKISDTFFSSIDTSEERKQQKAHHQLTASNAMSSVGSSTFF